MGVRVVYMVPFGMLKLWEFVALLISWALMANVLADDLYGVLYYPKPGDVYINDHDLFLITINVITWVLVMTWFILNVVELPERINLDFKYILFAVPHIALGALVLAAGSWTMDYIESRLDIEINFLVRSWHRLMFSTDEFRGKYTSAAAFGIISGIVLIIDGVVHITLGRGIYCPEEAQRVPVETEDQIL